MRYVNRLHFVLWVLCTAMLLWGLGLDDAAAQGRGRTNGSKSKVERERSKQKREKQVRKKRKRNERVRNRRSRKVERGRKAGSSTRRAERHRNDDRRSDRRARQRERQQPRHRAPARTRTQRHRNTPKQRGGRRAGVGKRHSKPSYRGYGKKHRSKGYHGKKHGWKHKRYGGSSAGLFIDIDIAWPWKKRRRARWSPHYEYRQSVTIRTGRGYHAADLDVRTRYHHRIRRANNRYAVVEIVLDEIAIYDRGRFVGAVDRIPRSLRFVEATIYRSGRVDFDRDLFLVGDPAAGFELIATPYYSNFVLDAYQSHHRMDVGVLDLYREEVVPVRRSRLFHPAQYGGYVPISLLPDDLRWRAGYASKRHNRHRRRHYDRPSGASISIEADVWLKRLR